MAPNVTMASPKDRYPELAYDIRVVDVGNNTYFVDLLQMKADWMKRAGDSSDSEATALMKHFDLVLAKALARWRSNMQKYYYDVVSVVPVHNNFVDVSTTGLIIFVQDRPRLPK